MTPRTLHPLLVATALVPALLASHLAHAAEDAGTQSVFAYGAGDRALAMGSAFVAAADDASALYWNPAGLGLVSRSILQLNTSGDLGLGFRESYAAMALPSWRWGTLGLTLRQFGTGGIEQRDERNVLLSEDLQDSELEMALGFGRALGETWTVGGAVKLQRQSLAGLTASGLGVDLGLGVNPTWMKQMRVGFAVRNAIQPSLRLDRETLPDPMTVRTGISYHVPLAGTTSLLAEVDVEKSAAVSGKLHSGLEYRFLDIAALRAGLNGNVMTAGTGFRWGNLSLDYTFENHPLATAHRAGVSLRLGATVDASRLAARQAEDQALEKRLVEAFQQRQAEQVQGLMERGAAALKLGQFDDALEALGAVLTLEPANPRAIALHLECLHGKALQLERAGDFAGAAATYDLALASAPGDSTATAGATRCRNESDRNAARTTTVRALFASAMDALAAEDFVTARDRFAEVLKSVPTDTEAARMLARTEQSLARRAARLVDAAHRDLKAGRLAEASDALAQAARLDRHAPGLEDAGIALAREKQVAAATAAAAALGRAPTSSGSGAARATPAAPVSTLSDREVEDLYRLGLAALKARRVGDALRYWEHVWTERPGYREVGDFLKREYLARGMESFASGKLEEAVSLWEKVLRIDPNDAQARGYVSRAQTQLVRSREILGMGK